MKKIVFIINPISGTGSKDAIPGLIGERIDTERYAYEIVYTEYAGHASEITKDCVARGIDIVVAVGGDGTVNEVARALVGSATALAIIPCGSGNGLARHLMLPTTVERTLDIINEGVIHDLDYGVINGHPFFCTCGMGFDAFISKKFAEAGKRGKLTYLENVLKEGMRYEPETYSISLDGGEPMEYEAFLISIANASQYGNDAYIAPQASMADGLLDIVIMQPFDILEAPQLGIDLMSKTLNQSAKTKCFKATDIMIRRSAPGLIHYDGDPVEAEADLHIELKSKQIRIVVNEHANKNKRKPNIMQSLFSQVVNDIHSMREDAITQAGQVTQQAISQVDQRAQQAIKTAKNLVKNEK